MSSICWDCEGKGEVRFVNGGAWGNEAGWMKCPTCGGAGIIDAALGLSDE